MRKIFSAVFAFVLLVIAGGKIVYAQRITVTIAGNTAAGYAGDGLTARHAMLNGPQDVATDAARNVYFTDELNGRIRKVSVKTGIISTIAGGGTSTLDGIPATDAIISPKYICMDLAGNLYFVSNTANQIKRIDAVTNLITTVAGTGAAGYSGDGGLAVSATFNGMLGIGIDPMGNIYVVDSGNAVIRKIATSTGIVTTYAGTGTAGFTGDGGPATAATLDDPSGITVNAAGDVFVMDQSGTVFSARLRKITAATGYISTIAGGTSGGSIFGAPLLSTWLADVTGVCMDDSGNFYCNEISCSCRKLDMAADMSYAIGGNFGIESFSDCVNSNLSWMDNPYGICIDAAQDLYVADKYNNRIRKLIQLTHTPTFAYGEGQSITACGSAVLDSELVITDIDSPQTETWTVLSAPAHGTLSGFPVTAASQGQSAITIPSGTMYTSAGTYTGIDSFKVQVSDGALTDVVTIYVNNVGGISGTIAGPSMLCTETPVTYTNGYSGGTWSLTDTTSATISTSGSVMGNLAGITTIQYAVNNVCGAVTYTKTITIDAMPPSTAGTITGPEGVCAGAPISYADLATGGTWSVSNGNASVTSAGIVTGLYPGSDSLVYTVTNGCGSVATQSVIAVNPLPVAGVITAAETNVCKGATITLSDPTAVGTGVWTSNNTNAAVSAAGVVTGITAGADYIYYNVSNSCGTVVATMAITINNCSNVGVPLLSAPVPDLFPNPATSVVNLEWDALQTSNVTVTVFDLTGRIVLSNVFTANGNGTASLNVSTLTDGVYMITSSTDTEHFTDKITITK